MPCTRPSASTTRARSTRKPCRDDSRQPWRRAGSPFDIEGEGDRSVEQRDDSRGEGDDREVEQRDDSRDDSDTSEKEKPCTATLRENDRGVKQERHRPR